jgi:magnesium transporter
MSDAIQNNAPNEEDDEDRVTLSDERIEDILDKLHNPDIEGMTALLKDLSVAEAADLLHKINPDDRRALLEQYGNVLDPYVFNFLDPELRRICLSDMPASKVAGIIAELDSDDALDLILNLNPVFQKEILYKLSTKDRMTLEEGLTFPADSAGRLMQREFVAVPEFWSVGDTIDYLRSAGDRLPDDFFDLIVIDPSYHVRGEIPLDKLIRSKREEKVRDLTLKEVHTIPATLDQEEVAHIFRREELKSAPVVDDDDRLIGVITIDDVIDVIDEEAQEDILKLAGVKDGDLYRAVWSTTAGRFKWLFVNLLTAILASVVISFFDATIEQVIALAILMPIVASMGGNAGTQALTVAVRALATRELSETNTMRIILKETLIGTINGAAFAVLIGGVAALWFHSPMLGVVIGCAMILNLICAGLFGAGIPIFLNRIGTDPALASTVFLTTITDVVGFFGFLGLASVFLID